MKPLSLVMAGLVGFVWVGCGAGDEEAKDTEVADTIIKVMVHVPDDFDAVPQMISASLYHDSSADGMPCGKGVMVENPEIGLGKPFEYETTATQLTNMEKLENGKYYMAVALYVEGGHGDNPIPIPKSGVDWLGKVEHDVTMGESMCNAGSVVLQRAP